MADSAVLRASGHMKHTPVISGNAPGQPQAASLNSHTVSSPICETTSGKQSTHAWPTITNACNNVRSIECSHGVTWQHPARTCVNQPQQLHTMRRKRRKDTKNKRNTYATKGHHTDANTPRKVLAIVNYSHAVEGQNTNRLKATNQPTTHECQHE